MPTSDFPRLVLGAALGLVPGLAWATEPGDVVLAPHRAVYELKLDSSRNGKSSMQSVRGRILYDFSGSACEGYALQFRQASELDTGEGKEAASDLRATTWEDSAAKTFRFNSQNSLNDKQIEAVDGNAQRGQDAVTVSLAKPEQKSLQLGGDVVFPTEHMRRVIAAARDGKRLLQLPVFDGSENGQKIYDTLTVIGQPIAPDQRPHPDAAAGQATLAAMRRWPVTISYFDKSKGEGEQTPVYAIGFELYENGISRALRLDYNDFVISGELSSLDVKDAPPCDHPAAK